jgi:hypothetical protein
MTLVPRNQNIVKSKLSTLKVRNNKLTNEILNFSQCRTFRRYQLLTQHIPNIEKKLVDMDIHDLNIYFWEVSSNQLYLCCRCPYPDNFSYGKALVELAVTMWPT